MAEDEIRKFCSVYAMLDQENACNSLITTNYSSIMAIWQDQPDPWSICVYLRHCTRTSWPKRGIHGLRKFAVRWWPELKEWWETTWKDFDDQARDRIRRTAKAPKDTDQFEV
jgi:hypothetical protein